MGNICCGNLAQTAHRQAEMAQRYRIVDLPKHADARGTLSFAQTPDHIPFVPLRMFMLFDMKDGAERGDHAHRAQHQFVVMMHGSATIEVDDGNTRDEVLLDGPTRALHVPPMLWLKLRFQNDSVCAVLASGIYDETDYIRNYAEFLSLAKSGQR